MPLGRPRVLVVEDDPDLLVVIRVNLAAAGLEPILAGDGRTAVARCQAEKPDAVLLDVMLPGIDGWQVLEALHDLGDPVPVVVCSAKKNPEDFARAEELGAVAYLRKPFDIDALVDAAVGACALARAGLRAPAGFGVAPSRRGPRRPGPTSVSLRREPVERSPSARPAP